MTALPVPLVFAVDYPSDVRRHPPYTARRMADVMAIGLATDLRWGAIYDCLVEAFTPDEIDEHISAACSLLGPAHDGE